MRYDYEKLKRDTKLLLEFKELEGFSVGKSVCGRELLCIKTGRGKRQIVCAAAVHGLEYLTAAAVMKFISDFIVHYMTKTPFFGADAVGIYEKNTVYFIPMLNPDGVDIAVNGANLQDPRHRALIRRLGIREFTQLWQANARGVDLNHNYNAMWQPVTKGIAPSKYGGKYPESEPETKAVTEFIRKIKPDMLIALHSQGEEIYYDFCGNAPAGARERAEKMAAAGGYRVCEPEGTAAFGGMKDWFIKEFKKEGYTLEIGKGKNPLTDLKAAYEPMAKTLLCAFENCNPLSSHT